MENIRMRRMGIWSEIISDITAVSAGFFLSMKIFNYSVRQTAPFYVLFLRFWTHMMIYLLILRRKNVCP